jgi:putative oxygen-independent coproporphyrinogen III oxidase
MPGTDQAQLAVYIHWPFCKAKCPYCDFNSHVREQVEQDRWRHALLAELAYMAAHMPDRRVSSIFFGGGTPSLMPASTVGALIEAVHAHWPVSDDVEITLEANPTSVEAAKFRDFRAAGINRASLGIQSLRNEQLAFLGREHNAGEAMQAIDLARRHFDRYSFDLIYARPGQSCADWEQELGEALRFAGNHLSLYQLTIEENTAFHHAYAKGGFTLPGEEEAEALYRLTENMLAGIGLLAYEVSNYARPGEESRHNLAYWQGTDYIGVGPGAHGRLTAGGERIATQTLKSPERWLQQVEQKGHGVEIWRTVPRQEEAEERLMMGLRLREGIHYAAFEQHTGYDLRDYLSASRIAFYTAKGLLEEDAQYLRATLNGRLVLGTLTAELLR